MSDHKQPEKDAPGTNERSFLVGIFTEEDQILAVTRAATDAGVPVHDAFTPYAVHGLDRAQKLKPSWLTWVCFGGGALGLATGIFLQGYTSGVDTPFWSGWPLNVGGKPFLSWPAFVPVIFELTVLFAGLISVAALFAVCGLFPGKKPKLKIDGVTNDRFALVVDPLGDGYDDASVRALFEQHGAAEVYILEAQA